MPGKLMFSARSAAFWKIHLGSAGGGASLGMVGINKKMFRGGPDDPKAIRYEYEKALLSCCPLEQLSLV